MHEKGFKPGAAIRHDRRLGEGEARRSSFDADRLLPALYGAASRTTRRRTAVKIRATETVRSSLRASDLFDLLADPRGCMTWHGHPEQARPTSMDAPPGPAVAGTTVRAYGRVGPIPCLSTTTVDVAEKPRHFVTTSVSVFDHPRTPKMSSVERIAIEDDPKSGDASFITRPKCPASSRRWNGSVGPTSRCCIGCSRRGTQAMLPRPDRGGGERSAPGGSALRG